MGMFSDCRLETLKCVGKAECCITSPIRRSEVGSHLSSHVIHEHIILCLNTLRFLCVGEKIPATKLIVNVIYIFTHLTFNVVHEKAGIVAEVISQTLHGSGVSACHLRCDSVL